MRMCVCMGVCVCVCVLKRGGGGCRGTVSSGLRLDGKFIFPFQ